MTFEKWCQTHQITKGIGRDVKSYLKWAWEVATKQEQERCAGKCDAVAASWMKASEAKARCGNAITSATALHKAGGAAE